MFHLFLRACWRVIFAPGALAPTDTAPVLARHAARHWQLHQFPHKGMRPLGRSGLRLSSAPEVRAIQQCTQLQAQEVRRRAGQPISFRQERQAPSAQARVWRESGDILWLLPERPRPLSAKRLTQIANGAYLKADGHHLAPAGLGRRVINLLTRQNHHLRGVRHG